MHRMLTVICFSILGFVSLALGQDKPSGNSSESTTASFASEWSGVWKGTVRSQIDVERFVTFEMQLTVEPIDANKLRWQIVYDGQAGRSVREYELIAEDAAKGLYKMDEKNGIILPARLLGNRLAFHFEVQDQHLLTTYDLVKGEAPRIEFDIVSSTVASPLKSGGKGEIPEVNGYAITNHQHAVLLRSGTAGTSDLKPNSSEDLTQWTKLKTDDFRGKQDDLYMVDATTGWYVNGSGKIYKTVDSGDQWTKQLDKPGTYFRCLAFIDPQHGFAGNIGPDYFPGVTDKTPLYETQDGGETWTPVSVENVVGLCSMQVLREKVINAGVLEERIRLIGVGRVGGPVAMIVSDDLGKTWQKIDVDPLAAMLLDVHFFNRNEGFLAAASSADVSQSNALILATKDGGKTWKQVYRSQRPFELTWKMSFPSREVGYVTFSLTIQTPR